MNETERGSTGATTLYLDAGNTRLKAAVYTTGGWQLRYNGLISALENEAATASRLTRGIGRICLASVVGSLPRALSGLPVQTLKITDIAPPHLDYDTPSTLGVDRFLACLGAAVQSQGPVVVVDAGTACTLDFMDGDLVFRGGVITPGLGIREQALRDYAPALPGVSRSVPADWPGRSTAGCLQWGLTGALIDEITAALVRFRSLAPQAVVWLTGGDAPVLAPLLPMPVRTDPSLVFEGMRRFELVTG